MHGVCKIIVLVPETVTATQTIKKMTIELMRKAEEEEKGGRCSKIEINQVIAGS